MQVRDERGHFVGLLADEKKWAMCAMLPLIRAVGGWTQPFPLILRGLAAATDAEARRILKAGAGWENWRFSAAKAQRLGEIGDAIRRCAAEVEQIVNRKEGA